ncbi:MAG: hypothetical protein WCU00_04345 [Candidatus Latescibacterota bacterium]
MKKFLGIIFEALIAFALIIPVNSAFAIGTAAGTNISSKATASYTLGTNTITKDSNISTVKVAEILNVTVTWQDAGNVSAEAGDTNKKLLFKVTNTGNGPELFTLTGLSTLVGDQFDPTLNLIYIDNGDGLWNAAQDLQYDSSNKPNINPDANILVWVDNTIPNTRSDSSALQDGDVGKSQLTATCVTGSGTAGTIFAGQGQGGTDAVVGTTTGTANTPGNYIITSVVVEILKNQTVISSPTFGSQPIPGSEIEYTITVHVTSGNGTAKNMTIKDPIPDGTTYKPGSIILNTVSKGDSSGDSDGCDFNITNTNAITVQLGNMTTATPLQTIKFNVIVN